MMFELYIYMLLLVYLGTGITALSGSAGKQV
jgi:hypothetical protein